MKDCETYREIALSQHVQLAANDSDVERDRELSFWDWIRRKKKTVVILRVTVS